ncbi:alpha/beta hydrolase family protein [Actinophytocola oryzae]|uniref:Diaminobutyrate--2-oxoglutarate transaminase n=1 Tax=Actinophytocola oryzae TaxID=502181 RepID=A0A4R7V4G5_9PSEU|nr:alpha/beta hydrolase family protein [Actinophytocola oryzae]
MPYDNYFDGKYPDFLYLERLLDDASSGLNAPAAVIVETVQGEGGINVARSEWLTSLATLCREHGILLIVDDVQMGCGRTGPFFSFEDAAIVPDIVCLSKSISGYGMPMALTLVRPDLDVWEPGEHNGTFRGNNPAFVTATAALRAYWSDDRLEKSTLVKGEQVERVLQDLAAAVPGSLAKGRGLARGLSFDEPGLAGRVAAAAFQRGLLVETSGPDDEVVKDLARQVRCPTLIVHSRDDPRVPISQAKELAELIPDSRLVVLDGRNHLLTADEPAWPRFLDELHAFLAEEDPSHG